MIKETIEKLENRKKIAELCKKIIRFLQLIFEGMLFLILIMIIVNYILHIEKVVTNNTVINNLENNFMIFVIPFVMFKIIYELLKAYIEVVNKKLAVWLEIKERES